MTQFVSGLPRPEALSELPASAIYVRPLGMVRGPVAQELVRAGQALSIQGHDGAFASLEVIVRAQEGILRYSSAVTAFEPWRRVIPHALNASLATQLENIARPPPDFAGLDLSKPRIMGIVNVTPDSFSDGGDYFSSEDAIAHGIALAEAGAAILDVGGESTRPGAQPVDPAEEQARVVPVVKELAARGLTVSIDTRNSRTMTAALEAGAVLVNDVTALTGDPNALSAVVAKQCPVVLMHMLRTPQTMQESPDYDWAPLDIYDYLAERITACRDAGVTVGHIAVDPGLGFGKTLDHNLQLVSALPLFLGLGAPLLLGASRKSFIGRIAGGDDPKHRLPGSLAIGLQSTAGCAHILRVHDVAETRQALAMQTAVWSS